MLCETLPLYLSIVAFSRFLLFGSGVKEIIMQTVVFKKEHRFKDGSIFLKGEEGQVSNNEAHYLVENGIAVLRALYKPPRDKMIRKKSKKVNVKVK